MINFSGFHYLFFRSALLLALLVNPLRAANLALGNGEQMTFRVGWGIFIGAGEIKIGAELETDHEQPQLRVTTTTATRGFLKNFFPFEARSEAVFDPRDGLLLRSVETSKSKRKETRQTLEFDYANRTALYDNAIESEKSKELQVPDGNPMDLITSLVQTRAWDLQPGQKQDTLVIFDDDFYELTIYAEGYETLRTPLGEFNTLVLVPRMEKTAPKGMFKRGSTVKVWISHDERRLPVRFEVEFKFGAGVATLVDYTPPLALPVEPKLPTVALEVAPHATNPCP
ncbi:MAG: DUF3108 domain-containing protein [Cephaloticoccus sp.]|nr:DUF3108 domain-containing protein [Cephaloticoccus sp.]MCF7759879.1 DUF3108 domain-containing protein [Cephaloticoccus sp.]